MMKLTPRRGHRSVPINGNRQQEEREYALEEFRSKKAPILMATNVAANSSDTAPTVGSRDAAADTLATSCMERRDTASEFRHGSRYVVAVVDGGDGSVARIVLV